MTENHEQTYRQASRLAEQGDHEAATRLYGQLEHAAATPRLRALVANDLGVLAAVAGETAEADRRFQAATQIDPECKPAVQNLQRVARSAEINQTGSGQPTDATPIKVAILSFLFNWPSTGGGIIHTVELAQFLKQAGYEIELIYPHYPAWSIGGVDDSCPVRGKRLDFDRTSWNKTAIKGRFRRAVDAFDPDYVLITDCWNFKPHLADALKGYPYVLRMQAQECLCPLNNLRLLPAANRGFQQCAKHQLATPQECVTCLIRLFTFLDKI